MAIDVLVTGGAGVLGRHVVDTLRSAGYRVMATGRTAGNGVDAVWDLSVQDAPSPGCQPSVVVHAAAQTGAYQQPICEASTQFDVNVMGTLRVARWCLSRGVERLVLVSGAIVYGKWTRTPKSERAQVNPWVAGAYAVSKLCSEQVASLVKSTGCELTILRLSSLYGTGYDRGLIQRLARQGQNTGTVHLTPPVDDAFDLLHVRDAASTLRQAVEAKQTGLWNVGSGGLTTIRELAEGCGTEVKAEVTISGSEVKRSARIINWVDDRKARLELGHINNVPLATGIAEIAHSLR